MSSNSVSQLLASRLLRLFGLFFLPKGAVGRMIRGDLLEEYGLRQVRSGRASAWFWLSLSVVAILALGIGANTAIFSVVDAVLLSSLPYQDPDGLVRVIPSHRESASQRGIWSPPDFEDFEAAATAYHSLAGYNFVKDLSTMSLVNVGEPVRLDICMVSREFFSTLGSQPLVGRIFDAREMVAGDDKVAILSHSLWQQRFEADPSVVGRSYSFDGQPFQIIGVMPEDFRFPAADVQLWVPISLMTEDMTPRRRNVRWISMIARLEEGVSPERAQAEAEMILQQLETQHPDTNEGVVKAQVTSLKEALVGSVRPALLALQMATALVLILAWANVGNLILARASGRGRELAVRHSLGASRSRLTRQLVTENLMLAVGGGVLGFLFSVALIRFLMTLIVGEIPRAQEIQPDLLLFVFALLSALVTGIVVGWLPAFRATQLSPVALLKDGSRSVVGNGGQKLRAFLLATEVALALMLAIGCSLMLRTFWNLLDVDPGFQTHGVYRMSLSAPSDQIDSFPSITAYHRKMLAALEVAPGVIAAGGSKSSPLAGAGEPYQFTLIDSDGRERAVAPEAGVHIVTPGYFDALGIVMRHGRSFTTQDSAPAGVINAVLAEQFFPDGNVLERSLNLGDNPVRIVGVVESVHHLGIQNPAESAIYLPHWYFPRTTMNFYVRMANPSAAAADAIRQAVWSVNPRQPIAEFSVMGELVETDLARPRFMTILMVTFAALAVALTALGIYGVVSYRVGQRTSELGIRLALGASRASLLRLVVAQSMALCGLGVVAGLIGAIWLSRFLSSLLYGVSATDLPVFGIATAIVVAISLVASLVPAQRATRVDPISALRCD